jgi:hypothetical protein
MLHIRLCAVAAIIAPLVFSASPAHADFCVQVTGGSFSGDLGFFRFRGDVPTTVGTIKTMRGRVAGLGPVFGTAVVTKDGSIKTLEIGATFFADATQGQINIGFSPPGASSGSGNGAYGDYGTGDSLTATKVACATEP